MRCTLYGICNGTALRMRNYFSLLKDHDFDCWIVAGKNIPYQQNVAKLPCMIIVLDVFRNTLKHIAPLFPDLLRELGNEAENKVIVIAGTRPT